MKRVIILLVYITSITTTGAMPLTQTDPLIKLTETATEHKLEITKWEVTMKNTIPISKFQQFLNNHQSSHLVTINENENSIKYLFEDAQKMSNLDVQYIVVVSKGNTQYVEQIAVIKGDIWNDKTREDYIKIRDKMTKKYFKSDVRTFTCIELKEGAIMDVGMHFVEALELVHMNVQNDKLENSTLKTIFYGYTKLWNQKYTIENESFNFQMVVTELEDGDLAYTIGTPILINEY